MKYMYSDKRIGNKKNNNSHTVIVVFAKIREHPMFDLLFQNGKVKAMMLLL